MSVTSLVLLSEEKVDKKYFSHISVMAAQPQSLASQAGLVSLELIHANCVNLENGYIKFWLPELSKKDREYEEKRLALVRDLADLETCEVILRY